MQCFGEQPPEWDRGHRGETADQARWVATHAPEFANSARIGAICCDRTAGTQPQTERDKPSAAFAGLYGLSLLVSNTRSVECVGNCLESCCVTEIGKWQLTNSPIARIRAPHL